MPVADVARPHRRCAGGGGRQRPADLERHHAPVVQEDEPANRAAERELAPAVVESRIPAHRLRKRQIAQCGREDASEHGPGRLPGLPAPAGEVLPFWSPHARQVRDVHPVPARESECCARRLAAGIEGAPDRRSRDSLLEVGLAYGELSYRGRQPARAGECAQGRTASDPLLGQPLGEALGELRLEARNPARGHFFATDLEEQLPVVHVRSPSVSCCRSSSG